MFDDEPSEFEARAEFERSGEAARESVVAAKQRFAERLGTSPEALNPRAPYQMGRPCHSSELIEFVKDARAAEMRCTRAIIRANLRWLTDSEPNPGFEAFVASVLDGRTREKWTEQLISEYREHVRETSRHGRVVTLRSIRGERDSRSLWARLRPDGTLTIEGQDLGDGVEGFWGSGFTEYEWALSIKPQDVARLMSALGSDEDVLVALAKRFSNEASHDLEPFLKEHGIPYEFWSRVGD